MNITLQKHQRDNLKNIYEFIEAEMNTEKGISIIAKISSDLRNKITDIHNLITDESVKQLFILHIITMPVFNSLFDEKAKNNTITKIFNMALEEIIIKYPSNLDDFYSSIKNAFNVLNCIEKQKAIIEFYEMFYNILFPKEVKKKGIVYTPIEIVDFIINSVEDILQKEFGRSMTDENVEILDPCTGTGVFITRLLQSGLIKDEDIKRKYNKEIYANEIDLIAYYIASNNIENVYKNITNEPIAFMGINLVDTLQLDDARFA